MARRRHAVLLLLVLLSALGLAACGGGGGGGAPSGDARDLVRRALETPIDSGRLDLGMELRVAGVSQLEKGVRLQVRGPFSSNGASKLPSADLDVSVGGAGPGLSGGLVLTKDNAYVRFGGQAYEVGRGAVRELNRRSRRTGGRTSFRDFGIDVGRWLRDPRVAGREAVAGTETTKVSGQVDVPRLLRDFAKLGGEVGGMAGRRPFELSSDEARQLADAVGESRVDLYVAGDGTLRRAELDLRFSIPERGRERVGGATGGTAKLELTISDVGEAQRIEAPKDARPLAQLLQQFGLGPETLLQ